MTGWRSCRTCRERSECIPEHSRNRLLSASIRYKEDPVKVRCLRILQGSRHDGCEIEFANGVTIGREYVVLGVSANEVEGAK
jgi:hypothetical protein